jgi:hypothetical protein
MDRVLACEDDLTPRARGRALGARAFLAFWQGDADAAKADFAAALERFREVRDDEGIAYCSGGLGMLAMFVSGGTSGDAELRKAGRLLAELGDRWGSVFTQNLLNFARTSTALPDGEHEYRSVLDQAEAVGALHQIAVAQANVGRYYIGRGDAERALPHLHASLEALVGMRSRGLVVYLLDALAEGSLLLGEAERAVRLSAAAQAIRDAISAPLNLAARERNRRNLEAAKEDLDEERFHEAWVDGAAMSLDEAAAEALAVQPRSAAQPASG